MEVEQDHKKNPSVVNVSDIKTVTVKESGTGLKFAFLFVGALAGGLIGIALAPEPTEPKTSLEVFASGAEASVSAGISAVIGALVGAALGYVIGNAIKISVEYDILDPESKSIIYDNCLHNAGLSIK